MTYCVIIKDQIMYEKNIFQNVFHKFMFVNNLRSSNDMQLREKDAIG